MNRRALPSSILLVATLSFAGCLTAHPPARTGATPQMRPEAFFLDMTRGEGVLQVLGRPSQALRVTGFGEITSDGAFRLEQEISIGVQPSRTRIWLMRSTGPKSYTGSLSDADGATNTRVDGNTLRVNYRIGTFTTMHQRIVLQPNRQTALNYSTIRVLGVPVARLSETITRER